MHIVQQLLQIQQQLLFTVAQAMQQ